MWPDLTLFLCEGRGVHIIIAVGHSGFKIDQKIAKEVEDIDLVVGGHTNTFLFTGKPPSTEKPVNKYPTIVKQNGGRTVPVVQAYYCTKYLGYLQLQFSDDGEVIHSAGDPILLNNSFKQDKNHIE